MRESLGSDFFSTRINYRPSIQLEYGSSRMRKSAGCVRVNFRGRNNSALNFFCTAFCCKFLFLENAEDYITSLAQTNNLISEIPTVKGDQI